MHLMHRLRLPLRTARTWFAVGIVCTSASACVEEVRSPFEVMGHYALNHGRATDVLDLLRDGRYIHSYTPPGGRTVVDTGTWSFNFGYDGRPQVFLGAFRARFEYELNGGLLGAPGLHLPDPATPALTLVSVERTPTGKIELVVDWDLDWAYVKVNRKR